MTAFSDGLSVSVAAHWLGLDGRSVNGKISAACLGAGGTDSELLTDIAHGSRVKLTESRQAMLVDCLVVGTECSVQGHSARCLHVAY